MYDVDIIADYFNGINIDNISIETFGLVENEPISDVAAHSHSAFEIVYLIDAYAKINDLSLHVYDAILYPPGVKHKEYVYSSKRQKTFFIRFRIPGECKLSEPIKIHDKDYNLLWLFTKIHETQVQWGDAARELILAYFKAAILNLKLYIKNMFESPEDIVSKCKAYIKDNIHRKITPGDISSFLYISYSSLSREFKKNTNMTITGYMNQAKIEYAQKLLAMGEKNVKEVAALCGFDDCKYFSRIFKKITGIPPAGFLTKT